MNREAVALGTPVYTIFSGRMGGVDEALIADGRLRVLDDPAALELRKRDGPGRRPQPARPASCWSTACPRRPSSSSVACGPLPSGTRMARRPSDAVLAFLVAAAIAWLLVPLAERLALPDRRDRLAQGAQPARRADAEARAAWRSSSAVEVAGWIWLPWDGETPRDPARRRRDRRASASSTTSSSLPALPKLLGQIGGGADPGPRPASRVDDLTLPFLGGFELGWARLLR